MKNISLLISASLIGKSEAFSSTGTVVGTSAIRPNSALKDAAMLDPTAILQGGDPLMLAAGGAVAAVAAAAAAFLENNNKDTSGVASGKAGVAEPEAIDVSIPYNSAALLAFSEAKLPKSKSKFDEFESLYVAKTVADVTVKKMARDVVAMEKVAAKLTKDLEALS
ncbi:unnamed protein product [Cylindrotheca closterium]|uniref:Uncharacterized protein n=1 Tax=Cylindrotheca closterium TaxID=2856 RepID=A0AAD2GB29_9STRA|nr:unnamed protein product [Cylindrotheca closterium]